MKNQDDFESKKNRKPKIKKQHIKNYMLDDEEIKHHNSKKEIKKIKKELEDEEWEDWDRYYNH